MHRAAQANCEQDVVVDMKTATLQVMNGVAVASGVRMRAVNGTGPRAHSFICDLEVP